MSMALKCLCGMGEFIRAWGVGKVSNEFINDGNILYGSQTFTGAALSSDDCDGEIQYISISPSRAEKWTNR